MQFVVFTITVQFVHAKMVTWVIHSPDVLPYLSKLLFMMKLWLENRVTHLHVVPIRNVETQMDLHHVLVCLLLSEHHQIADPNAQ